ncbi:MAG: MBL fold metallo-hydrolase [Candidatus Thermoplasmatota archaeon]|nr:MBL fold metallo-hydrolase [Candidatus Thermoplasmatota archaeon]
MKLNFAGGVDEIGSLGMVAESGDSRILFDYGMTPSKPPQYPMKTPSIDAVFLTHSHLDHIGNAPWLCGEFGTTVWGTEPTMEVATVLLQDSLKIAKFEGWALPFNISDLRRLTEETTILRHNDRIFTGPFTVKPMDAGHIPGSTMYKFNDGGKEVVFTGDINTVDTKLVGGIKPPQCDVLIMESTYAGREHPPRKEVERTFIAKVEEVLDRGGKVIVPAFAVGRTQEIVQVLDGIKEEKWLDGMGRRVAQIYLRHGEFLKSPGSLKRALDQFTFVRTPNQRDKAAEAPIVVTTSGMLDGGPVLKYLGDNKKDKKSAVLLTGYQVEGTNGRMLMDSGSIDINGEIVKIDCEVVHFDFSAHAGHDELVKFAEGSGADEVILMHGDRREELAKDLGSIGKVHTPGLEDVFTY